MTKAVFKTLKLLILLVAIFVTPEVVSAKSITIGSIGSKPSEEIKKFIPLARYLAKHLLPEGIEAGKVIVAKNLPHMASYLKEGKADLYIDSPFPVVAVSQLSGSRLLLRRWKKGVGEYHTVIFVRKNSGIEKLEDLKGKMLGFEEPFSSSGYLLPKMVMMENGLKLAFKERASEPVAPDEVGYLFSNDDENSMVWVLRGKLQAAAMDNYSFLKMAKGKLGELKVICETFSIPRHVVSYRADLPAGLVARIREILIRMEQSEEGRKVLQAFERTTRFDEIPEESISPLAGAEKFISKEFGLK